MVSTFALEGERTDSYPPICGSSSSRDSRQRIINRFQIQGTAFSNSVKNAKNNEMNNAPRYGDIAKVLC